MNRDRNFLFFAMIMIVLFFGSGATAFGVKIFDKMNSLEKENKLTNEHNRESNKEMILLKVISEKMPNSKIETQIQLSKTIYSLCSIKRIPISLVCGLIEVESTWDTNITSSANAKGLMQPLSSTARPYLRIEKIDYNSNILYDPIVNVIVGISYLADLQAGHIEARKTKEDDFTFSLHSYFWGPDNTKTLYGLKDQKVNVPNLSYPLRVQKAAKFYEEKGL